MSNHVIIDHVMYQPAPENSESAPERIFDTEFTAVTDDGEMDLPLSDHYGVKLTITR